MKCLRGTDSVGRLLLGQAIWPVLCPSLTAMVAWTLLAIPTLHAQNPKPKLVSIQGQNAGVGIAGIRERAHHLRGTVNIQSSSSGTTISVTVPVPIAPVPQRDSSVLPTRAAG